MKPTLFCQTLFEREEKREKENGNKREEVNLFKLYCMDNFCIELSQ
jgi:hypothetical protein